MVCGIPDGRSAGVQPEIRRTEKTVTWNREVILNMAAPFWGILLNAYFVQDMDFGVDASVIVYPAHRKGRKMERVKGIEPS